MTPTTITEILDAEARKLSGNPAKDQYRDELIHSIRTAITALGPVYVVKELEWIEGSGEYRAYDTQGYYVYNVVRVGSKWRFFGSDHNSLASAKSAAQSHYNEKNGRRA